VCGVSSSLLHRELEGAKLEAEFVGNVSGLFEDALGMQL